MNIFVDCDVLLDIGLAREPFCDASGKILDYLETHQDMGFIAWHSIANFFYITAKCNDKQQTKAFISDLCQFLTIVPVSNRDLLNALELPLNDFEDAMQCAAALACGATVIISRNVKDYQHSPVKALTPEQFLQELQ